MRDVSRVEISTVIGCGDRRRIEYLQKLNIRISMITAAFHTIPPLSDTKVKGQPAVNQRTGSSCEQNQWCVAGSSGACTTYLDRSSLDRGPEANDLVLQPVKRGIA